MRPRTPLALTRPMAAASGTKTQTRVQNETTDPPTVACEVEEAEEGDWVKLLNAGESAARRARTRELEGHRKGCARAPAFAWFQLMLVLGSAACLVLHQRSEHALRELEDMRTRAAEARMHVCVASAPFMLPANLSASEEAALHWSNAARSVAAAIAPTAAAASEAAQQVREQAGKEVRSALGCPRSIAHGHKERSEECRSLRTVALSATLGLAGWAVGVPFVPGPLDNLVLGAAGVAWPMLRAAREGGAGAAGAQKEA